MTMSGGLVGMGIGLIYLIARVRALVWVCIVSDIDRWNGHAGSGVVFDWRETIILIA